MESMDNSAQENLRRFFERIERLEEEKAGIAGDIKEVYEEAKSFGYDPKVMRKVIALRKLERQEREELEALTDLYLAAVEG
jgi:uncharacterized protein (UPF0335 family)